MNIMKNTAVCVISVALLIQMSISTALAVGVTMTLSAESGYKGDDITISGTCDPNEWIIVKAIDSDGNIVYIKPVMSEHDGSFSTTFIVPEVDAGMLQLIAGSGSNVASADFTVKVHSSSGGSNRNKKDPEKAEITNGEGEAISGTVADTKNGFEITINGGDFNTGNSGGSIKIAARSVEVTFHGTTASYIRNSAGSGNIVLRIDQADISALSDEAQNLIGNRPVFDITLLTGDTQISDFGGKATVTVSYEIAAGEDPNAIVVYYVDDDGNLTTVRGNYDMKTQTMEFTLTHFSQYAVGYNKVSFADVSQDAWYYDAVTFCAAREITTGTGDDMFSPDSTLTRGQFLVMLMRSYRINPNENTADNFDDAGDTYYMGYLASGKILGITNGVGDSVKESSQSPPNGQTKQTLCYKKSSQGYKWESKKKLTDG